MSRQAKAPGLPPSAFACVLACGIALAAAPRAGAATPMVSTGQHHSVALAADGTVRAWGSDRNGQLGVGRRIISTSAIPVAGISHAAFLSAADSYSLAVDGDGAVWGWGYDGADQLGDGIETDRSTASRIAGLPAMSAVSGRNYHAVGLQVGGAVWAWGENGYGEIGIGTTTNQPTPVQVPGLAGFVAVSAGDVHTLALRGDGTVFAWGANASGQVGNGASSDQLTPVAVPGLAGVTRISAGGDFNLALKGDGTVWSWGGNESGQLGDGTFTDRHAPVLVAGLPGAATAISAGGSHALALMADGTVWAWGYNGNLLGDGTSYTRPTPGPVSALTGVVAISAGSTFSLALKSDGTVWSWGFNDVGQLADGTVVDHSTPVQVVGLSAVDRISAGYAHALVRKTDGSLWSWGDNGDGELGDGTLIERSTPARVVGLSSVTAVASGDFHVLALKSDGTVWAWGGNAESELGDGTTLNRAAPAQVPGVSGVTAIAAGGGHSIARKNDGTLLTWGYNYSGQLGYGPAGSANGFPQPVPGLTAVSAISAGYTHSLAVRTDGTVWAWGSNESGELGDATTTDRSSPTQVPGITGVIAVSAGNAHTLALKGDGSVWAWGNNASGQLGDGTTTNRTSPVPVAGLAGVIAISAGGSHSLALRGDGSVWAWGANDIGTLGDGTTTSRLAPVAVAISNVAAISAGRAYYYGLSLAAKRDGSVWAWGDYRNGQLGDGTLAERDSPIVVVAEGGGGSIAGNDWFLDLDPSKAKQIPPDKIPALLVVAAGNTRGSLVEVNASVKFRAQDVGNPIYVFGYVPATLIHKDPAGKDGATCVLAQLSPSGVPQQASASSLQGYVSNVVSTQGQAVSVLNSVAAGNVAGSTFCVGTAGSSGEAVATSNSTCVATVPPVSSGGTTCLPSGTVSADVPGALSGLWWNPGESGWGIDFTQRRDIVFAAWYTYDDTGNPKWYVAPRCQLPSAGTSGTCTETVYEVNGPTFFGTPFNAAAKQVTAAGSLQLTFTDANSGSMTYTVANVARTVSITRLMFPTATTAPPVDYTDLWWNPNESGWGLEITQQFGVMFLAWYVYDGSGKPTWYVAPNCSATTTLDGCAGTLYRTTGPAFATSFDHTRVQAVTAGTVSVTFSDPNNGSVSYTVDGVSASKAITRQLF